jgi:paraquat-inducible protein B
MFENGEGVGPGTKIKLRSVDVGEVRRVSLNEDGVLMVVTARMIDGAERYLKEGTRFWIIRPRINVPGVGLNEFLSGAFIEIDPGWGSPSTAFVGLKEPPPIRSDVPGTQYALRAESLGSVSRGSPVYYRSVQVGQVLSYEFADDRQSHQIQIFVNAPHDQLVRPSSRFWNASGVNVSFSADGVDVTVESLQALFAGGVAFDTPEIDQPAGPAAPGTIFPLFASLRAVTEAGYTQRIPYLVHFDGSVHGLRAGAPVEFRGIRVGTVTDVRLEIEPKQNDVRIPVMLEIEPQRLGSRPDLASYERMEQLVARGLRAQLKSGNLLTGELLVDVDFHLDSPPAQLGRSGIYPEIPSVPAELEALQESVTGVLEKLAALPMDKLNQETIDLIRDLKSLVASPSAQEALEAFETMFDQLTSALKGYERAAHIEKE